MDGRVGRDILQAKLLAALFKQDLRKQITLKGGMAMRTAYGSTRYTKDIDLNGDPRLPLSAVERAVNQAFQSVLAEGLVLEARLSLPRDVKRTETVLRWKLNGRIGSTLVHLTVEVSRRAPVHAEETRTVMYTPPAAYRTAPFTVDVLDAPVMALSKVECLISPNREAPRDIYDLAVLIELGVSPSPKLVARLGREKLERGLDMLWSNIEKMDWDTMRQRMGEFLDPDALKRLTPEVWEEMRLTVGTRAEAWMRAGLEECGGSAACPPESAGVQAGQSATPRRAR